jgi:hypothetical protein
MYMLNPLADIVAQRHNPVGAIWRNQVGPSFMSRSLSLCQSDNLISVIMIRVWKPIVLL